MRNKCCDGENDKKFRRRRRDAEDRIVEDHVQPSH